MIGRLVGAALLSAMTIDGTGGIPAEAAFPAMFLISGVVAVVGRAMRCAYSPGGRPGRWDPDGRSVDPPDAVEGIAPPPRRRAGQIGTIT